MPNQHLLRLLFAFSFSLFFAPTKAQATPKYSDENKVANVYFKKLEAFKKSPDLLSREEMDIAKGLADRQENLLKISKLDKAFCQGAALHSDCFRKTLAVNTPRSSLETILLLAIAGASSEQDISAADKPDGQRELTTVENMLLAYESVDIKNFIISGYKISSPEERKMMASWKKLENKNLEGAHKTTVEVAGQKLKLAQAKISAIKDDKVRVSLKSNFNGLLRRIKALKIPHFD